MQFVTRVDQLAKELKNTVAATIGGVQKSTMKALHGVMSIKGGKMSAVSLFFVFSFFGSNSFHENIVFCFVLFCFFSHVLLLPPPLLLLLQGMVDEVVSMLVPMLSDASGVDTQKEAARCLGVILHYVESGELTRSVTCVDKYF